MSFAVNPISQASIPQAIRAVTAALDPQSTPGSFQGVLEAIINHTQQSQSSAVQLAKDFLSGDNEELHTVALATQRAELEFNLLLQIRNKAVSAYQEIMRMQV